VDSVVLEVLRGDHAGVNGFKRVQAVELLKLAVESLLGRFRVQLLELSELHQSGSLDDLVSIEALGAPW